MKKTLLGQRVCSGCFLVQSPELKQTQREGVNASLGRVCTVWIGLNILPKIYPHSCQEGTALLRLGAKMLMQGLLCQSRNGKSSVRTWGRPVWKVSTYWRVQRLRTRRNSRWLQGFIIEDVEQRSPNVCMKAHQRQFFQITGHLLL